MSEWERFKERVKESVEGTSWARQSASIEELVNLHLPEPLDAKVERFSDGWYALQLRHALGAADSSVERGHAEAAAANALQVGMLLGAMPGAREWLRQHHDRIAGGAARAAMEHAKTRALVKEARKVWQGLPVAQRSQRTLVAALSPRVGIASEALRKRLRPHRASIEA